MFKVSLWRPNCFIVLVTIRFLSQPWHSQILCYLSRCVPCDGAWCLPLPRMRRSCWYPMPLQVAPPPKERDGGFTPPIWSFEQVLPCRIKEYNAFKGGNSTFNARIEGAPWSTCAFYTLPACQCRNLRQALKAEIFGDGYWTNAAASYFLMASTSGRLATPCPIHNADAKFIRFAYICCKSILDI